MPNETPAGSEKERNSSVLRRILGGSGEGEVAHGGAGRGGGGGGRGGAALAGTKRKR